MKWFRWDKIIWWKFRKKRGEEGLGIFCKGISKSKKLSFFFPSSLKGVIFWVGVMCGEMRWRVGFPNLGWVR